MLDGAIERLDAVQARHRPLAFAVGVVRKFGDDDGGMLAALVAYYGFFSLFPLLLVLVTVASWALQDRPDLQERLVGSAFAQFPLVGDELRANLGEVRGSGLALVVGLVVALWGGTAALQAAQHALNVVWGVPRACRPGAVASRLRSFAVLGVLALGLAASTAVAALGALVDVAALARAGVLAGSAAIAVGIFLVAFRVLPGEPQRWGWLWPGAVIAGVAWVGLQTVGVALIDRQLRGASQLYGTFGLVLGLLSWLYLQAQATMVGAEVNVVRARGLWPRSLREPPAPGGPGAPRTSGAAGGTGTTG